MSHRTFSRRPIRATAARGAKEYTPVAHYLGGRKWACGPTGPGTPCVVAERARITCKRCLTLLANRDSVIRRAVAEGTPLRDLALQYGIALREAKQSLEATPA